MRRESILTCFAPPEGFEGDFGWVCGFTANAEVLEQMADRFTNGARRRRPSLAVFLHPPERHLPLKRGVTVLFRQRGIPLDFNLLHAKVALLRFHGRDASMLRLVVSTGNWTHDPMTGSLDLFWIAEFRSDVPDPQAASDICAAADMFSWLRQRFDTSVLEVDTGHGSADRRLQRAIEALPRSALPPPRFLDSRDEPLNLQVVQAVASQNLPAREWVIMGSGYFETGEDADAGVLAKFVQLLRDARIATKSCGVDVVLNPEACQGLAHQAEELSDLGWTLRPPINRERPGAKLHAKFIFSASGDVRCRNPWCYIGSGNLSGVGFTKAARQRGNLEAGVVFSPREALTWDGRDENALGTRLPVDFGKQTEPHKLSFGEPYLAPGKGAEPPPVSYVRWADQRLMLPEGVADQHDLTVAMPDGSWAHLPAKFTDAPTVATLGPSGAQVPVLADGGFVVPPLSPMRVEDVLHALPYFPLHPPEEIDPDPSTDIPDSESLETFHQRNGGEYPTRRMMRLIVGLAERQARVEPREWERWVNHVEDMLMAMTTSEAPMIDSMRNVGIDPLSALLQPEHMKPAIFLDGASMLRDAITRLRFAWGLEACAPLVPEFQV